MKRKAVRYNIMQAIFVGLSGRYFVPQIGQAIRTARGHEALMYGMAYLVISIVGIMFMIAATCEEEGIEFGGGALMKKGKRVLGASVLILIAGCIFAVLSGVFAVGMQRILEIEQAIQAVTVVSSVFGILLLPIGVHVFFESLVNESGYKAMITQTLQKRYGRLLGAMVVFFAVQAVVSVFGMLVPGLISQILQGIAVVICGALFFKVSLMQYGKEKQSKGVVRVEE